MGSFTLQLSVDDSNSKTINANALKILIFMLYYVYYNTFEEPLNKHFFDRMTNDPAEQKSISFNSLMGKLLLHINTNSKNTKKPDSTSDENSDENSDESEAYSEIINLLAKEMSSGLERDLFTNLQATKLISVNKAFANDVKKTLERKFDEDEDDDEDEDEDEDEFEEGTDNKKFRTKSKSSKNYDKQSQSSALKSIKYDIAREKITKRIEDNNNIRLFNILNIINATIESHNSQLKYKLSLI